MPQKYSIEDARTIMDDRCSIVEQAWQEKRALWQEIYSLYRFWTDANGEVSRGERSNIFIPIAFSVVETKIPRMIQALLSLDPWFKVEGRTSKDHRNAKFMSDTMYFQLTDEVNAFFPFMMWWKEAMIYSNSYMFVGWEKENATVKRRFPKTYAGTEIIGYDYKDMEETVYDSITLNHLDLFDCFPAPRGTRINGRRHERMPYFILHSEPDINYLRSLADKKDSNGFPILDKTAVEEVIRRFPQGYGMLDENRLDRMSYNKMTSTQPRDTKSPQYVMKTMFENDWWVVKIADTVVANKPNPFGDNKIPIASAVDTPVPHEHIGIGQIEPIIKLQYYINDLENLNLDYLVKSINAGTLISQDSFLDPNAYMNDPDGIHVVKGNPNLAFAVPSRLNPNAMSARQEGINLERLIDKVLGQSDVSRGVSRPGSDTATEVVSLIEQANLRFGLSARILQNESLIPVLELIASRNQLFWPSQGKEIRKYVGEDPSFMDIQVSNLIGNYRYKMKTNPAQGNQTVYAQTLIRFLDVLNADQGRNPELVREIAKFLQISNVDEIVRNPAEEAVAMVVQAAREGLVGNSKQASLVLAKVLDILAPPGSQIAQKLSQTPATDNRGVAKQTAQLART